MRRSWASSACTAMAAACAALLSGCRHAPPPTPPAPSALEGACPDATPVPSRELHPVRVEVVNETDDALRIVLDRCQWWTRLGEVAPGRTAYLRLPDRLLRFGEGLRFHAFTESPDQWYGAFASDFQVPIAHLVVSPATALMDATPLAAPEADPASAAPGGVATERRTRRSPMADGPGRVSLFSFDSFAVLTWRCTDTGDPELTFASGQRLSGDAAVTLAVGSERRAFGTWSLVRAFTDGALAPSDVVMPFTAAVRQAGAVTLLVGMEGAAPQRFSFRTATLDGALGALACVR